MKLYVTSDIHLEFGDLDLENRHDVDVLILGGDICVARDLERKSFGSEIIKTFFQRVSERFPHVILIMGNHEHYHGDFAKTQQRLQDCLDSAGLNNVYILEKTTKQINGYDFIGGTLWTDFNNMDTYTMHNAESAMNDYRGVKNTNDTRIWKFLPRHALHDHSRMVGYLQDCMDHYKESGRTDRRVVVVTHHAPSRSSIHERWAHDRLMNGNFCSDLDQFILANPQIQLWTHGHTHENFDYTLGSTRVVCNPRGYYGHEDRVYSWTPKLIELS